MFLEIFELCKKRRRKKFRKNCFEMWCQILGKMAVLVHEISMKKVQKSKKTKILKTWKSTFFSKPFAGHIRPIFPKSDTTKSKQLFLNFFCLFSILSSKMSRSMRKLLVNMRNATIYPPGGPIKKKYILLKNVLLPHLKCKTCYKGDIWNKSRRRNTDLKNQGLTKHNFANSE